MPIGIRLYSHLRAGVYLSSQAVSSQVFSAQRSLTSVFGMGTGGTSASSTPADANEKNKEKKKAGAYLFSQVVSNQVSSAQQSLTSVFGMGTGGTSASSAPAIYAQHISLTYSLYPRDAPSKLNNKLRQIRSTIKTCGQALDLLVHASSTCHHAYTLCLSTL